MTPVLLVRSIDHLHASNRTLYAAGCYVGGWDDVNGLNARIIEMAASGTLVKTISLIGNVINYRYADSPMDPSDCVQTNSARHLIAMSRRKAQRQMEQEYEYMHYQDLDDYEEISV